MRHKNILPGLGLILIAVVIMGSAVGIIPDIPWFKLIAGCMFTSWALKALVRRDFFGTFMSLSIVGWIFDKEFGIEELAPFPLLLAAACLGLGLNMIFGKKHRVVNIRYREDGQWKEGDFSNVKVEEWSNDGRHVELQNTFNSTSKYVNAAAFSTANLENNFGSANVYFDNATIANNHAEVQLENNFGRMNIYMPGKWRATVSQSSAFGHVNIFGEPNRDMDAPHVVIKADSNFGELNIFFD